MHYAEGVEYVLVATDSDDLFDDVDASLGDDRCEVGRVNSGAAVFGAVRERQPDLVVLDLQIGNMGGISATRPAVAASPPNASCCFSIVAPTCFWPVSPRPTVG